MASICGPIESPSFSCISRLGTLTDKALIEGVDSKLLAECLNARWVMSPDDARDKMEAWHRDDVEVRLRRSVGDRTPIDLMKRAQGSPPT